MTAPRFIPNPWPVVDACVICGRGRPTRELQVKFQRPQNDAERRGVLVLRCCARCYRKRTKTR